MPTHCYTVCEHKQHSMDGMPRDESRMSGRVSCTGTRGSHFFHHDPLEEELDPCLSAAVRYNKTKGIGVLRWRYLLFCIVILLALALLVVALLMILGHGSTTTPRIQTQQQQQPSPNIIIVPSADPTTPAAGRTSSSTARTGNTVSTTYPTAATSAARPTPPISSTTTRHWVYIQPPKASPPKPRPATVGPPGLLAPPTRTPVRTTASTRATTRKTTTSTTIKPPLPVKLPAEPGQAEDCQHYYKSTRGSSTSRQIYALNYGHFYAYCQVESDHVWTVLQRRTSGKLPFWNATFAEYADGFGDPDEDHWLGLERVWAFVALGHRLEMRIRLEGDFCQGKACSGLGEADNWWGDWEFSIGNRSDHFRIKDLNFLRGNLSSYDSVQSEKEIFHNLCNGEQFTTVDADNDINKEENCASFRQRGAWWHRDCAYTALNGLYGVSSNRPTGLFWRWKPPMENITHRSYNIKPMKSLILFRVVP